MSGCYSEDDEIVIAGISGRFPESSDIDKFKKNLYEGVDMVTSDARRWPVGYLDLPKRNGKMKDIEKFDAPFFGIHPKQSDRLDPMIRMMLEATYEAITDAGYNIEDVRGTNTGVYIGCSGSDSLFLWSGNTDKINGYGFMGCQTAMFANRVSYTFDFKGPSFIVDTACSSSGTALHVACNAIKSGEVDAAVVGGVNLCIRPSLSLQFNRLSMLSHPGTCKAFDASGNGFVRSEAVVVVYLKKAKDSKRIYASIVNSGINCDGNKSEGITFPNGAIQQKLIEQVFDECGLDPNKIDYVECHGTGTKVGDPQELTSVTNFFCKTRKTPLLIGSVKSNMGHSEAGSALCSVAKIVLAMENNRLPGNLHFKTPNPDIPALNDGRLKVVSENMEWHGKYVAINSFGFGGANFHAILKRYTKPKSPPVVDNIPRLVCVSGRTEEAVSHMINYLEYTPRDDNMIALIHDVNKRHTPGHPIRGYTVLEALQKTQEITEAEDKGEIWFVFNGVGSQWPGMGKALMCLEPFSNAIHRSAKALETVGVDLLSMIENPTSEIYDNTVNLLVGITAIQVALVDVLSSVGIKPDKMAGHSAGEVACSYADGCLTIEQTVLCAYYRGVSLIEAKVEQGAMAAVGLKWDEVVHRVPQDVWAACNNAETSVTVSGREKALDGFVQKLQSENVFVKKVNSSNTGFHSPLIAPIKDILGNHLRKLIPDAKPRTNRWLSTSIPEEKWETEGKYLTADYFVNNMLMPVQFHPVISKIPENSIVVEIGGHSLLQAILKRAVPSSCVNIGFAKKEIPDEVSYLMSNLGKLYLLGKTPDLSALYKRPNYPVPSGTPMIAPLIKWDHSQSWAVADYKDISGSDECVFEIDTSKEKHAYINGHCIDGRVLFPATGYLTLIWTAYAKLIEKQNIETPVVMTNVSILRATIMPKDGVVKFSVNINKASGSFELSESGSTVVTGYIEKSEGISKDGLNLKPKVSDQKVLPLQKDEIYKDLRLRGYNYKGIFQGIKNSDNFGTNGTLEWNDDWISFMDTMLQFLLVGMNTRELYVPTRILKITIDPEAHLKALNGSHEIPVHMHQKTGIIKSGGIEIRNMKASQAPRRINDQPPPKTEQYCFVPFKISKQTPWENAVTACLQIVIENSKSRHIKVSEVYQRLTKSENLATPFIIKTMESEPLTKVTVKVFCLNIDNFNKVLEPFDVEVKKKDLNSGPVGENLNLVVSSGIESCLQNALESICDGGFIMTDREIDSLQTISSIKTDKGQVVLLRKVSSTTPRVIEVDSNFGWVETVKDALKRTDRVLIMSDKEPDSGILGFFNCLRQEPGGENLRCVFVADDSKFDLKNHEDQIKKDLLINVFKNGEWGSMRHMKINVEEMESEVHHAYINTLVKGDLSSLRWIQGPLSFFKPEHDHTRELCTVYYSTLNFKDVMLASGKLPPDALPGRQSEMECILGFEYAGRDSNGTRTMGLVTAQAMATTVLADKSLKWPIPSKWSMAEASTIPAVYATSYYAMMIRGRLQKGEKVLIHAGTGGVGQAAIRIALSMNCEIFTTVGSQEKKDFLLKTFPRLNPANIGNSRDTSFEQLILERTEGQGVHIVLNSLAGEMLQASVRCLAEGGRFLEIGKADISQNTPIGMAILKKSVAVHGILLDAVFEIEGESEVKKEIRDLIQIGIESGVVVPLQTNIYHHSQVEQAFRFMASGKHIGKVILEIKQEESTVKNVVPEKVMAIPKTYFSPDKSYIVLGGLGGFGLEMANWMLMRGARHLILVSRKGVSTGYQALCLRRWKERGYDVIIRTDDATTMKGARNLLVDANKLAPVGGIFNLAAVLRDALMENLTKNDFEAVCKVKVDVCKNLDIASQSLCSQLDYFVMFSSVSSGRGNMGQTNYGWANSAMERICEKRRSLGLPGMAIQWGAIGDVGLVIESLKLDNDATIGGTLPQRITSCLNTLDSFLQTPYSVVSSVVLPERGAKTKDKNAKSLVEVVGNILGVKNVQSVAKTTTLADLGMDSLMGAEIKQVLERGYDLIMNAAEIRNLTFGSLDTLSGSGSENKIEEVKVLVRYEDRLMPDQTLVKMKSGDSSVPPFFFIHAIEGTVTALKTIVDAIKSPGEVYGLQSTIDIPSGTIRDMARAYIKEIKTVQPKGPYRLVGYSFGGTVAYEMAYLLENEYKEESFIVFIDSSPTYVVSQTKNYRSVRNEDADVKDAYAFFIATFDPKTNVEHIQKELVRLKTEEERLQLIADKLKFLNFDEKEIKEAAFAFGKRLVASDAYKTSGKIASDALLFSAEENFVQVDLAQTVKEICRNVTIHNMKGNHRSILVGESALKIAEIISSL